MNRNGVSPTHLNECLLCPTITIIHFTHHTRIQITKKVVRFDLRRREVPSTAIFITSFIQINLFCVVCWNDRPTQPPEFQKECRSACKTSHNLFFNIFYNPEKSFGYSNLIWISDELCLFNRI